MKVAIVVDWLTTYAGGERVTEQLLELYPQADIFATIDFVPENERAFLKGKKPTVTFAQHWPWMKKKYRSYLPIMPMAIESLDVSGYDVVISNSHCVAKGVITGPEQLHIAYVLSPVRYAWDLQHQYLTEAGLSKGFKGFIARAILHYIRMWDVRTANGVNNFVGISEFIRRRIYKVYRRKADVIYPPVDTGSFVIGNKKDDFYLAASRMVPYKRMELIVQAFAAMPDKKLVMIGDGPDFEKIKKAATPNVSILGYQPKEVLVDHMQRAKGFVFAALEDFGIAPVEAQACGTPVIGFAKGGCGETTLGLDHSTPTGVLFKQQTIESICNAVKVFENNQDKFKPENCRKNALKFSNKVFRENFARYIKNALSEFDKTVER